MESTGRLAHRANYATGSTGRYHQTKTFTCQVSIFIYRGKRMDRILIKPRTMGAYSYDSTKDVLRFTPGKLDKTGRCIHSSMIIVTFNCYGKYIIADALEIDPDAAIMANSMQQEG